MLPLMYSNSGKVTQDDKGPVLMLFTILLTKPAPGPVTVDYATSDHTAFDGKDYTATSGTLTIPAGAQSGVISVTVLADPAATPITEFFLTLSNPTGVAKLMVPKFSGIIYKSPPF